MPNVFDGNTFAEVYKDDYVESDGYHRVLFNSGRALQARELTQLQTILQEQITSFGENIFLDGASVNPKSAGMKGTATHYIKITRPVYAGPITDLIGASFRRTANLAVATDTPLEFKVSHIVEFPEDEADSGFIRIYGRYMSDGIDASNAPASAATPPVFVVDDVLVDTLELAGNPARFPNLVVHPSSPLGSAGTPVPGGPNVGYGFTVSIESTKFFTQGHFVVAPKQSIIASEFDGNPNLDVGFEIVQDIVTVEDTDALFDNQGVRPNLSSPGADRYRIRLLLTTRTGMAADSDGTIPNYLHYASVRKGVIVQIKEGNENYNQVEKRLAQRTDETNGDFIVNPFMIQYEEGPDVSDPEGGHGIDRIVEDTMIVNLPTPVASQTPLAYLDGYRLQHQVPVALSVKKPLSSTVLESVETSIDYNNFVTVFDDSDDFGVNLARFTYTDEDDILHHRKTALVDSDAQPIGTARLKSIRWFGTDSDAYHVHLYDIQLNEGKNFRNVRKIAQIKASDIVTDYDSDRYVEPLLRDNQLYINDAITNTSIFPIEGSRVKNLTDVTFTVQRYFIQNTSPFTIGTNAVNQNFDNVASWIVIDQSTDRVLRYNVDWQVTSGGDNSSSASITVDGAFTGPFHIYAEVEKNSTSSAGMTHTTKNYKTHNFVATYQGATFDDWRIGDSSSPDGFLYDGVRLISANIDSANGTDILPLITFDGGQKDNYYAPVSLKRNGLTFNSDIHVKVGYFRWSEGDYLCANSYVDNIRTDTDHPDFDSEESPLFFYSDIPSYTTSTTGRNIPLEDAFDFRERMDPRTTETPIDRHHLPLDDGTIRADIEFYHSRVDTVSLGYNQNDLKPVFSIHSGAEALRPTLPERVDGEMPLFTIRMPGNTKSTEDLVISIHKYKGFKMKDIKEIEDRVELLEETVSLSFLENNAANLVELDAEGNIRSKTGFFVDDFSRGFLFSSSFLGPAWVDDDNFATECLELDTGRVLPKSKFEHINMLLDDSDTLAGSVWNSGYNTKLVGDQLYLDYVDVLDPSMSQEMISWYSDRRSSEEHGWYNVNPYNVFVGEGHVTLNPATDNWMDTRRLPDNIISGGTINRLLNSSLVPRSSSSTSSSTAVVGGTNFMNHNGIAERAVIEAQIAAGELNVNSVTDNQAVLAAQGRNVGRRMGARITQTTRTTTTVTQSVQTRVVGSDVITQDLGDKIVATHTLPFARSRMIYGKAEGLRPNTRFWPFFDGVDVSQWCVQVTQQMHIQAMRDRLHLQQPDNSIDVNVNEHPDAAFLSQEFVSDYKGDLFFQFLLPNNASTPGNLYTSVGEWGNWIEQQRRLSKQYGSSKNPEVYNDIGWKFRTGSMPFKFLDISEDNEDNALCLARTTYTSSGSLEIRERDILSTRVVIRENFLVTSVNTNTNTQTDVLWIDPLAQSFMISAETGLPGAFVTKIEVFIRRAPEVDDIQIPLQMQIRDMQNGYPTSGSISSQHRVYKPAEEVRAVVNNITDKDNLGDVLANPVTFELPEPVYLQAGKEYAICLLAECDNYEAYVGTTYGLVLGKTSARVNKQPAMGSLFLSQNGSTWTAKQNQDMAYRIYTAKFKPEGEATFYNQPYKKYLHNSATTLLPDSDQTSFHVSHLGHGLGVGDRPELQGLDSASTYFGVTGSDLMDPSLTVIDSKINGYRVRLNNGTFNDIGPFGSTALMTNRAFYIDQAITNFMNVLVPETDIRMESSFISGISHSQIALTNGAADPRFEGYPSINPIEFTNHNKMVFKTPKMLAAHYMETEQPSVDASIQIRTKLLSNQTSVFGIETDADRANYDAGYTSDVTPFIDTQRTGMVAVNYLIDNQPRDSEVVSDLTNVPNGYIPESHPRLGTSPSKHITVPIILEQAANGIRVFLEMHKPQNATIDVYYRTGSDVDDDLYTKEWVYIASENNPPNNPPPFTGAAEYSEYSYLIGGRDGDLTDFLQFQLKMVFRSTNTCEPTKLKSIRAIAVV